MITLGLFVSLFLPNDVQAELPHAKSFDLNGQEVELLREKSLQDHTVLQSFAFDYRNQHIYTVQLMAKGYQFSDERRALKGAERASNGDLVLTKLDMAGNKLGYMYLRGFGHGVSIGVEPDGKEVYIWTESDAVANGGKNGWGKRIARFPFMNEETIESNTTIIEKFEFLPNVDHTTVNIDHVHNLLTMRYRENGEFHFALYHLDDVKRHHFQPIVQMTQPQLGTFQGFVSYGDFLYLLEGNNFGTGDSEKPKGNTYITTIDWKTGKVIDKRWIGIASDLPFREPEGMGIYLPRDKNPNETLLCLGFASTISKANAAKVVNIFGFPLEES
ncbi:hypothetical protein ACA30_02355 [Virgibacillus soli]|nr:hypothetical protein ACA30_02355 [Virgibacillus soli]